MTIQIHWRLPTHGDGRSLHPASWNRGDYADDRKQPHVFARTGVQRDGYTYYDHLAQIARGAELGGFDGVWIPHSPAGEEGQVVASSLAREARRVNFVPTLFTPLLSAVYSAKIAVSFQRLSGGRLDWNFAFEDESPRPWQGRQSSLADQVARTDEFLHLVKGFWNEAPFTWQGRFYEVLDGGFPPALQGQRLPRIHISGDHDEALQLSAKHADVHVLPVLPLPALRERIAQLDELAALQGRELTYALEADIVVRHDDALAWAELQRQWDVARQKTVPISGSAALGTSFEDARVGPNLFAGFSTLRPGAAHGLVGGYASIAQRLAEYIDAGITTLVLSAPPHLEEAYRFGEFVIPSLRGHVAARAAA
ncbi:MAG: LLM class flavin-dependent oxidoreductase [Rhizobacter sp.]